MMPLLKDVQGWKFWVGTLGLLTALAFTAACGADEQSATLAPTPTATIAPAPTATSAPSPTATIAPSPTATIAPAPTATIAPAPTATLAPSPTATIAPAPTATLAPTPTATPAPTPNSPATSLNGLPQLTIREVPSDLPTYDRDNWRLWVDDDRDCQDARQEVLIEESVIEVTFTDERRCRVLMGEWLDPYTGETLTAPRGLDIDHMVPLANAYRSGAWEWDADRRRAYANDLTYANHLIAVSASANRSKSDRGPEEWRPPNEVYWCQYATDWITIKADWGLSATQMEWDALMEMAVGCDGQAPLVPRSSPTPTPTTAPAPTATLTPSPSAASPAVYGSCEEAERADVPRQRGSQGNGRGFPADVVPSARDGDGDGVVCER